MKIIYVCLGCILSIFILAACASPKPKSISSSLNQQHAGYIIKNEFIIDTNHHLMWENEHDTVKRSFKVAKQSCGNLILGGHSDWRLPTVHEVVSILDYTHDRNLYPIDDFTYNLNCYEGGTCSSYIWTTTKSPIAVGSFHGIRVPIQVDVFTGRMFVSSTPPELQIITDKANSKCVRNY